MADGVDYEKIRKIIKDEVNPIWRCIQPMKQDITENKTNIRWLTWSSRVLFIVAIGEGGAIGYLGMI